MIAPMWVRTLAKNKPKIKMGAYVVQSQADDYITAQSNR